MSDTYLVHTVYSGEQEAVMQCLAPGCCTEIQQYATVCEPCNDRVDAAMLAAKPALIAAMEEERVEAEAWLAGEWSPKRRWAYANHERHVVTTDELIEIMVDGLESRVLQLAFVDDDLQGRMRQFRLHHDPEHVESPLYGWVVPDDGTTMEAWNEHMTPILQAALEHALATFPTKYAGQEIKDALTQASAYGPDDVEGAFLEMDDGTGRPALSIGAMNYLVLAYDDAYEMICQLDDYPDSIGAYLWGKYPVLPEDIMQILAAIRAADSAKSRT
jgi:hypothetical protein